ncbi:MAG: TonB-dependent receptor [Sphingomonas sp.]|uniref:TonB-dependent receptor domain-containing protein n=1 Tax=Sphingomonas sp. TaxID=28214 RepID=UPI001B183BC6|nr:TonB-dependent receptor [Sphingomonas sp.]MBO9622488.1 TonB-dependent receptor [Sphingomonas sp.]
MIVSEAVHRRLLNGVSFGAVALALGCVAFPAAAQEAPAAVAVSEDASATTQDADTAAQSNEIVVTGFRASLRSSLREKRDSNVQLDAINAEDIANFPDANLAESLQRLPGVSIDRDNGEGRQISVRGLGGDFNRTRLNGLEALATAGSNDAGSSPNRSRAFDYNTFASELFSSLRVQKTPSAETDEGSLGATIDLITGKPFDYKDAAFALSAQGSYQKNSERWSPRIAGLVSKRFMGGDMGFLISGAYSKSDNELDQYRRGVGSADYLYRGADFAGNETPQRGGFAAPTGTNLGTAITNPDAIALLTGSDPTAYANLYPGAPFNTPGRFDDSQVRIPALPAIEQQNVKNDRLGLTAAYQWKITPRTELTIDGVYSRFHNTSIYNQISPVGLNRNNTNAAYNTAGNNLTPSAARALYPGLCTPAAETDLNAPMDCGQQLFGTTPAFATAYDQNGNLVPAVLGGAAVVPGGTSPANANIFSTNPNNLDPYDYYNNPNSVGYIPSTNRLAYRGQLIGRPAVKVLESNVTNGLADYLVLQNVDFRSAQDQNEYTTEFRQGSIALTHEFSDTFRVSGLYGQSRSTNVSEGRLVEFNRMDSQGLFVYDERDGGPMPKMDFGFDVADPNNWETVKGFSAIRRYVRHTTNTYEGGKLDLAWDVNPEFTVKAGFTRRTYTFYTDQYERVSDLLNPTLKEAGVTAGSVAQTIQFGQGLNVPEGTPTSFVVPSIAKFDALYDFTCNCVNQWGDWRITRKRNRTTTFGVTETDTGGYLQVEWDTDVLGGRFRGNAGTRMAVTDLVSTGETTAGRPITGSNNYTDFLPSVNLVYEPTNKLVLRASVSKVMARPLLGNLSPSISAISIPNTGDNFGGTLTIGNPKLSPFRATNIDLSAEWYFAPGALISLAAFHKEIDSFPQTILYEAQLSEFADAETIEALKAQFTNANQIAYLNGNYPFLARQYRDAPGGYVRGIEANFQMDLTFLPGFLKHLGVIVNGTYIESEMTYILDPGTATIPQTTGKGPFLGVSPKALNATVYYETDRFRIRLSSAYRAGYSTTYPLAAGSCSPGISTSPVPTNPNTAVSYCGSPLINDFIFSKATFNLDASASFNVTDWFSINAEALNLTNQTSDRYAYQGQDVVSQYASSGTVYRIGARVRF